MSYPRPTSRASAPADKRPVIEVLERSGLLDGLTQRDIRDIAEVCQYHRFEPNEDIFLEGQPCEGLWMMVEGRVRLYHSMANGRQQVVGFRAPGSALELGPALDGGPYTATATATSHSLVIFLPRRALVTLGKHYPVTIRNVIEGLCAELRQRDIATAIATVKDARGRVGCTLLQLNYQYGTPIGTTARIAYRLSRQDIADRSGVTLETAIRILSSLERDGIIKTRDKIIDIVDVPRLRELIHCDECQFDCSVFAAPYQNSVS